MQEKASDFTEELLSRLTLEEKCSMCHGAGLFQTGGVSRLNVPPLVFSDGPMGVRKDYCLDRWEDIGNNDDFATYLPSNSALAATWNPELAKKFGEVLGCEARGRHKDVILAPGINVMRNPLCGRNYEYMSEDPYLISKTVVPMIESIQKYDVSACVKHFAVNDQETNRLEVSAEVDERALHEIYFPGFKAAVQKGKVNMVMSAYNRLRGTHCCENPYLVQDVLKGTWQYDGVTVSDWGGIHTTKNAAENGCDIEMNVTTDFENYCFANPLIEAVRHGEVSESVVDQKVRSILKLMRKLKMFDDDRNPGTYNQPQHRKTAYDIALESFVLLKNESNLLPLPLKTIKKIAVVGFNADKQHASGGDSAQIKALYEITPYAGIKMRAGGNIDVIYVKGYSPEPGDCVKLRAEAVEAAKAADCVIYIGGLDHNFDTEGKDRQNLKLPYEQDALIKELLSANSKTVIVLLSGCAVDMSAWIDSASTVLQGFYSGMEGGTALAGILCGDHSPSGKLPFTIPACWEKSPLGTYKDFSGDGKSTPHSDSIFVGYRFYDAFSIAPLFPFGHGLSYTSFEYKFFKLFPCFIDGKWHVTAAVTIANIGGRAGAEIVQLYVGAEQSAVSRPIRELKGYQKVVLQPGEEVTLQFDLDQTAFAYYDIKRNCWVCEQTAYTISVASSSRDLKHSGSVTLPNEIIFND